MRHWTALVWIILLVLITGCTFTMTTNEPDARVVVTPVAQGSAGEVVPTPQSTVGQPGEGAINSTEPCQTEGKGSIPGACVTENVLAAIVQYLTFFAELSGALVIAVAVVRALIRFLPHVFGREHDEDPYKENIRLQLGKSLALALEFELGADILKTAVAPSFAVIAQLGAIIVLRTLLNYFLERELRQTEQRRTGIHLMPDQQRRESPPPNS